MDKIILVGAGGHARSCIDVIELTGFYKIAGLVEKDKEWAIKQLTGIKARGTEVPDLQIQEIEE